MIRTRSLILLGALPLLAACTHDETTAPTMTTEMRPLVVETESSRTQIAEDGYSVLWSPGDRIGIFLQSDDVVTASNIPLEFRGETPSASGRFEGEAAFGTTASSYTLYAYYPYLEQQPARIDSVYFTLPARQRQRADGDSQHLGLYDFAVAPLERSADGNFAPLRFGHGFAVIEVELTASGEMAGRQLASIALYATDPSITSTYGEPQQSVYLSGPYAFDLAATDPSRAEWAGRQARALFVELGFDQPPTLGSTPVRGYLTVHPGDYAAAGGRIYMVAETVDGYRSTVDLPGIEITAGQMRTIAREVTDGTAPVAEIDLSAGGRANCYIAHRSGQSYSFDATVAGNGVVPDDLAQAILRFEGRTLPVALAGTDARLLWQSDPGLIEPGSVAWRDGRIVFRTSARPTVLGGNAVIALYADASSDEALWSWHVWVTDRTNDELIAAAQTYVLPTAYEAAYGSGATVMMDRTLGALTDEQSPYTRSLSAMLFQWGRKDPFPAQNVVYTDDGTRVALLLNWPPVQASGTTGTTSGTGNTLYAIEHPATFIYDAGAATSYDWYYGGGRGTGPTVRNDALWGNAEGATLGRTTTKTLFDPCPAGWMLPHGYAYTAFTAGGNAATVSSGNAYVEGSFVQGWRLRYDGSEATYYPTVGSRNDELAFYSSTDAGFYWTSAVPANAGNATGFWMFSTQLVPRSTQPRATGNPLRCMRQP